MPAPTPVDTARRRALLFERHLLGAAGRRGRSVGDVAATLALLHSTDPSVPYLSVHARAEVGVDDIAAALYDRRSLIRLTTLRRTVFAMPHDVAADAIGCFNGDLVAKLRRQLLLWIDASPDVDGDAAAFLAGLEDQVVEVLRSAGPTTGNGLAAAIPGLRAQFDPSPGRDYSKPMRITTRVLELLAAECRIVRGRPTGDLTSGAWTWAAMDDWIPGGLPLVDPDAALAGLIGRYLAAFGPATVTDAAWWTGIGKTRIRRALLAIDAREVTIEGSPEPGWILSDDALDVATTDQPQVALLPGLDPTTMGWKQRDWYVDDSPAAGLFDRSGNAGPTAWVDGCVVGAWTQRGDGEVVVETLVDVGADARTLLDAEAERIAAWLGDVRVKWRYPTPFTKRLAG
ncbi:MAG: winged helix DNA-binding domain-containing protein [Acidimicrobiales bacterium]